MRPSLLLRALALSLLPSTFALDPRTEPAASDLALLKRAAEDPAKESTTFNGKTVPPVTYLKPDTIDKTIESGYWFVEYYSPYCHHCKAFAPIWQKAYELYYTSEPVPSSEGSGDAQDPNSFTNYYDYHFAKVDCSAEGDLCAAKKIKSFPTMILYKDGQIVDTYNGGMELSDYSKLIEGHLTTIRTGSRPNEGLILPTVKEDHVDKTKMPDNPPAGSKSRKEVSDVKLANPMGRSVSLTAENFQKLVTMTHDSWFIKFYTPWCQHCQSMAPNWDGMARHMKEKLNIGEVNCEVEKRLCKDVKVRSYPTVQFFRAGERIEYEGLRGLGDLVSFANKAIDIAGGIRDVNATSFAEMEKTEEVIFVYFYDHATTSEDMAALERLPMSMLGHAKLVKTRDPKMAERFKISTWPRLLVSRDGKPTYYTGLAPRDMRDYRRVLGWMRTVWLPLVPELTAANAREIMDGKLVVLGILSRDRPEEFRADKNEIKNAAIEWIEKQTQAFQLERQELREAKQLRIEEAEDRHDDRGLRSAKQIRIDMDSIERKQVGFAWVDGVFWERWIRTTFGISVLSDNERVVIYDHDHRRYWDVTSTGNAIVPSRTSILETLPRAVASPPKISPKRTMSPLGHFWWVIKRQILSHPIVSIVAALVVCVGFYMYARRNGGVSNIGAGYFKVGEKGSAMDGLLGGNGNAGQAGGKVD
ncbi:Hypothetical protein R9X50_00200000 [Acrodontium crateriforme]|uniref:Thioredoxin domain-containing protein n=1 Tax=Acrodontium crateriforme TaxID=150365 RepID=A0AAQ3R8M7_9PEZI|nr:Hypothetical protein R9X50_00200000 [Acrodontium crateriforme]